MGFFVNVQGDCLASLSFASDCQWHLSAHHRNLMTTHCSCSSVSSILVLLNAAKLLKLNFESSKGVKVLISEIQKLNYLVKLDSNRKLFRMTVFSTNFVCQLCRGFPQGVIV